MLNSYANEVGLKKWTPRLITPSGAPVNNFKAKC